MAPAGPHHVGLLMSISVRASSAAPGTEARPQRILLPFPDRSLPQRAVDTALRMARTENATLVPVRLERIPLHLPMDASPGRQVAEALAGIQRRARELGVHVDPRIGHWWNFGSPSLAPRPPEVPAPAVGAPLPRR